ncbi:conserved oligomeric Golgi complex subunit 4-like [Trifolium medium]|uniref:Conserved oligomeric Golgi complex subunit 4-like n=1 Tax=Trifolium medium TaxID=97028 RepID=A0A392PX17_9FABA|nr:conserved oligomeric Golgi complex subunit 4-like [Trifolium medium]
MNSASIEQLVAIITPRIRLVLDSAETISNEFQKPSTDNVVNDPSVQRLLRACS